MSVKLTRRETEVVKLLVKGYMQKEVADILSISLKRVEGVKADIKRKWGVTTEVEFILAAIREGYLDIDSVPVRIQEHYHSNSTGGSTTVYTYKPSKKNKVKVIIE